MRSLLRRPALAFALGLCVAVAAFAGTEAWARLDATDATNTITACVKRNGDVSLVEQNEACKKNESRVTWNIVGPKGDKGDKGDTGATGAQGATGATGAQGATGATGAQGATGQQGPQGQQGPAGANGQDGDDGAPGAPGAAGAPGASGAQGPPGPQGAQGQQGQQGPPGASGGDAALTSPNGLFKIVVTDSGIRILGPGGNLYISYASAKLTNRGPATP